MCIFIAASFYKESLYCLTPIDPQTASLLWALWCSIDMFSDDSAPEHQHVFACFWMDTLTNRVDDDVTQSIHTNYIIVKDYVCFKLLHFSTRLSEWYRMLPRSALSTLLTSRSPERDAGRAVFMERRLIIERKSICSIDLCGPVCVCHAFCSFTRNYFLSILRNYAICEIGPLHSMQREQCLKESVMLSFTLHPTLLKEWVSSTSLSALLWVKFS